VREVAEEVASDFHDKAAQAEDIENLIDQDEYVIYTNKNIDVIRFTDHGNAIWDEGQVSELSATENEAALLAKLAFFDMRADVLAELEK
jgi:hypothetical protein